jgi:Tol biopolymer transport system component/PKD repeat protein
MHGLLRGRHTWVCGLVALALGLGLWGLEAPAADAAPSTTLDSVSSSDVQANDVSAFPVVTPNGRWVAFSSFATNLAPGATQGHGNVFLRDRLTGVTQLISAGPDGQEGSNSSGFPQISNDGRYIAFVSHSSNLVSNVSGWRIYRYDRVGQTLIALPLPTGEAGVDYPSMTADGSKIAFVGFASVGGLGNVPFGNTHVYAWNAATGAVSQLDELADGTQSNGSENDEAAISGDGTSVAFSTNSPNLTPADTSGHTDVVVKDLASGSITLVSVGAGTQVNGNSAWPAIDADGCVIAFTSTATNLVQGDTISGTKAFVRDRCAGSTEFASITNASTPVTVDAPTPGFSDLGISDNGCLIVYMSENTTPPPSTGDGAAMRDRCNGVTSRLDLSSAGDPSTGAVESISISHGSGRYVPFASTATDLVGNDTNGESDAFLRDTDASNTPPDAELSASASGMTVTADASASNDPDGFVLQSSISFGDGSTPQTGVHAVHTYTQPGTYGVAVTVTDADGASSSKTVVLTVSNSGGGGGGGGKQVHLSGLGLSHSSFAVVIKGAKFDRRHGSTLSLSLNVAATVKLSFARVGRRSNGSCRLHARKGAHCSVYSGVGLITRSLSSGEHTIAVSGIVAGKALAPGTYRLTVTARAGGRTATGQLAFTIAKVRH